jgi:glycosyltransferase involved in cell wall biosynthesis
MDMTRAADAPPSIAAPSRSDVQLLLPKDDVDDPELTILIPAMNEELTVGDFVAWCHEGIREAGVAGEVLIVDSSADRTAEIALVGGARVLRTPRRGLGRAYIDALPYIRGRYVVMGDADCTYDFRQVGLFVDAMREGNEFAMGSRWRGSIEPGAMPKLHQYFGTPVTTWALNILFGSRFSDIHCGMRGITRDALLRMGLVSQSWEYASEMVLKSVRMGLKTVEVPVTFLKDRDGRLSHHKRSGWFSPFHAAWINLRAMFIHGAEFFLFKPGIVMFALGLLLTLPLSFGRVTVGPVGLDLDSMFIGLVLSVLGLQSIYFGCLAHVFLDYTDRNRERLRRLFDYTKSVLVSAVLFAIGFALDIAFFIYYVRNSFLLPEARATINYLAITGLLFMAIGFSTFCFTLLLHATRVRYGARDDKPRDPH